MPSLGQEDSPNLSIILNHPQFERQLFPAADDAVWEESE